MTTRVTQSIICFSSPFSLPGIDEPQPAGDYLVDHDEELLESGSRLAWRRVGTYIHLPAIGSQQTKQQLVRINPSLLDAARLKGQQ